MTTGSQGLPTIDMRSISQLAEGDEAGDQFVAEIIDVFLADLSERVRTIGLQMSQNDSFELFFKHLWISLATTRAEACGCKLFKVLIGKSWSRCGLRTIATSLM